MRVTHLELANVRAIKAATFHFRPGFNLVVGANGVGKTTVLYALAVCLASIVQTANAFRNRPAQFKISDIRVGADALAVVCDAENVLENEPYRYVLSKPRVGRPSGTCGVPREWLCDKPGRAGFVGTSPPAAVGDEPQGRPLAVLFSTRRAVPSQRAPATSAAADSVTAAFSGALSNRELRLGEFAAWIRVQEALKSEHPAAGRVLEALERAVTRFLPDYRNLRLSGGNGGGGSLLIDRGATTLPARLLSDGERGALAIVLDLTRRLAQANPDAVDPAAEAEAVVLIDEIELHLHPAWQRRIVANLETTFPTCQFIATTHSPQVIGEVEHDRIHIIGDDRVYSPGHSFGVDSSRVLEEIMGAEPRTEKVQALLSEISRTFGDDRYDEAGSFLDELSTLVGENDPEVTRIRTLMDFMAGEE